MSYYLATLLSLSLRSAQPEYNLVQARPAAEAPATIKKAVEQNWWSGFFSPEVVIGILIPLASLATWLARDYSQKNQMIGRSLFREEMIESFSKMLENTDKERETLVEIRLQPLQYTIESLVHDLREGKLTDRRVESSIKEMDKRLYEIQTRLHAVETRTEHAIHRLNTEMSNILSSYLKDPVRLHIFNQDDNGPGSDSFI